MYCTYSDSEVTFYILWNRKIPMSHQILTYFHMQFIRLHQQNLRINLRKYVLYIPNIVPYRNHQKLPKLRFR